MDAKALKTLEAMEYCHDLDSVMIEGSLAIIPACYNVSEEYAMHAPLPRQRPYSTCLPEFSVSIDVLETGLRFPLHPIIEECLKWWRISPMAELLTMNENPKVDLDEACHRLDASDKELNDTRSSLTDAQKQIKDDLLKVVQELETSWVKLSRKAVEEYKVMVEFKLGLQWTGHGPCMNMVPSGSGLIPSPVP
ncbi:hypothetical protein B296_00038635 [Ensete ventricosum]|uniref:Uncharacterized protein n=1 Tax=Ensete ventricosum TaxID=4639 RepID=A0A426ZVS4_ENSVE|nr:hypothetical protein B296_00038635 [Ensete ventricosum]